MNQKENTKREAIDEIRRTMLYIISQRNKGKDYIDVSDLLDTKLEKNILDNFNGVLSKEEYERLIFKIFQNEDIQFDKFNLKEINNLLEDLILKQQIRERNKIIDEIKYKFNVPSERINILKKYTLWKYRNVAINHLNKIIFNSLSKGITDEDELVKIIKKEGFRPEVEPKETIKAKSVKTDIEKYDAKQKQVKSVTDRLMKMKIRFIEKYCRPPKFDLIKNVVKDNKMHFLHRAVYGGREIHFLSISSGGEVENVIIEFRKMIMGQKRSDTIDINEMKNMWEKPDGSSIFAKRLKSLNSVLEFSSFQEVLWFLCNSMTEQNHIPKKSAKFIKDNFKNYVEEIEKTLTEQTVQKSLQLN
jgi:hypothetical protein